MEDVGCGSGGWTLAMKVKGDSVGMFFINSDIFYHI